MKRQRQATITIAGAAIALASGPCLLAGEKSPIVAPPPPPADCSGCVNPGFYVEGSLLYLNSYASDTDGDYDGEWDLAFRGTVGWENADGLFIELTGFTYESDYDFDDNDFYDGELEAHYVDLVIGDTIHCGETCLSVAAGLRYAELENDLEFNAGSTISSYSADFDGWGPVLKIEATRSLSETFSLYAELVQALLFGEVDYEGGRSGDSDTLASVTEIGLGVQYNFGLGPIQNAFIRAGIEGQYWLVDSSDIGLFGGVLKVGGRF